MDHPSSSLTFDAADELWLGRGPQSPASINTLRDGPFRSERAAYRLGGEARDRYGNAPFEDVESDLADDYRQARGKSRLEWEDARDATRAAWTRVGGI